MWSTTSRPGLPEMQTTGSAGPYQVVGKPSESLACLQPMGHRARGDRELTTAVDKLRVVRGPVPEDRLAPQVQVHTRQGGRGGRANDPRGVSR